MYQTENGVLSYTSKAPPKGGLSLQGIGPIAESVIDGMSSLKIEQIVDDPILRESGITITNARESGDKLILTVNEQEQRWHPIIFGACQNLDGIKKVALREYRQATA